MILKAHSWVSFPAQWRTKYSEHAASSKVNIRPMEFIRKVRKKVQKRAPTKATRRWRHAGPDQQPRRLENETTTPGRPADLRRTGVFADGATPSRAREALTLRACKLYDPAYFQQNCHTGTKGTSSLLGDGGMWKQYHTIHDRSGRKVKLHGCVSEETERRSEIAS